MNQAYLLEKLDHRIQQALTDKTIGEIILNSDGRLWFVDHQSRYVELEFGHFSVY